MAVITENNKFVTHFKAPLHMKPLNPAMPAIKKQWIAPEITVIPINGNGVAGADFASEQLS